MTDQDPAAASATQIRDAAEWLPPEAPLDMPRQVLERPAPAYGLRLRLMPWRTSHA